MRWYATLTLLTAALLTGCGAPAVSGPSPSPGPGPTLNAEAVPPPPSGSCPQGAPAPVPPPVPRTVRQLAGYATAAETARAQTEHARAVCQGRLEALMTWVHMHLW